jgi:DNA-binding PadR family transcriptional regulator
MPTLKQKILAYLEKNTEATSTQIANFLQANKSSVGVSLSNLKKEGYVTQPSKKFYAITEKGRSQLNPNFILGLSIIDETKSPLEKRETKKSENKESEENKEINLDLDSPELILKLKEKYGKTGLIKRLETIKRLVQ